MNKIRFRLRVCLVVATLKKFKLDLIFDLETYKS